MPPHWHFSVLRSITELHKLYYNYLTLPWVSTETVTPGRQSRFCISLETTWWEKNAQSLKSRHLTLGFVKVFNCEMIMACVLFNITVRIK